MAGFRPLAMVYGGSILMVSGLLAAACSLDSSGVDPDTGATTIGAGGSPTTTSTGAAGGSTTTGTGGAGGAGGGAGGSGGVGGIPGTGGSGGVGGIPGTGGSGGVGGIPGTGGAGGMGGIGGDGGAGGGVVCAVDAQFSLDVANSVMAAGTTVGAANDTYASGCAGLGQASGDFIYEVTANVTGIATAQLLSNYTGVLDVRLGCDPAAQNVNCDQGQMVMYSFPVSSGTTYYIIVDGGDGEQGTFSLDVTVVANM